MESRPSASSPKPKSRLLSNESLSLSESEYTNLLMNLSPRYKTNNKIEISITFFSKHKGKHVIYKISGNDITGNYESYRRYQDFIILRSVMAAQWPGCYIPKLPPKKRLVKSI